MDISLLQVCRVQQYPFTDNQPVALADWELYIQVQQPLTIHCAQRAAFPHVADDVHSAACL